MKIYTSNYFNENLGDLIKIQISTSRPNWFEVDYKIKSFMPDWSTMVEPHKVGIITDEEYTNQYIKKLDDDKSTIDKVVDQLIKLNKDIVLLCWCHKSKFCHRHILANYLKDNYGLEVKEL